MNNYISIVSIILLLVAFLKATSIEMIGVTQYSLSTKGVSYIIKSQKRIIRTPKKKKNIFMILGRKKQYASNLAYYLDGTFQNKKVKINYKKAYWLEGILYMEGCNGELPSYSFTAKEVSFNKKNTYNFKTIEYKQNKKTYIKHNYSLNL